MAERSYAVAAAQAGKALVGCIDGARGLFAAAVRNFLDNVAVGRIGDLEHAAGPGFGPFACN